MRERKKDGDGKKRWTRRGRTKGGDGAGREAGREKDEGDEEGEKRWEETSQPLPLAGWEASRTKTQVHIQGDVGRWPGVTSIKDGLTSTDRPTAGTTTRPIPFLASYASLDNHRAGVSPSRERSFVHFLLPPPSSFPSFSFDREETETRDPRLRNWIYICGRRKKIYFPPCGRINFYSFRTVW